MRIEFTLKSMISGPLGPESGSRNHEQNQTKIKTKHKTYDIFKCFFLRFEMCEKIVTISLENT